MAIMDAVYIILAVLSFVGGQVYLFHMIGKWGDFVDKYSRP